MMKKKQFCLCFILLYLSHYNFAQEVIKAFIKDHTTQKGLDGATITIKSKNRGVYSDESGYFELSVESSDTIVINHIGYEPLTITGLEMQKSVLFLREKVMVLPTLTIHEYNKRNIKIIGLQKAKSKHGIAGLRYYALFLPNPNRREGLFKTISYRFEPVAIKHDKDTEIKVRVRVYSHDSHNNKPSEDLLKENIIFSFRNGKRKFLIDIEKYSIVFPQEGAWIGLEVIGCKDSDQLKGCCEKLGIELTNQGEEDNYTKCSMDGIKWVQNIINFDGKLNAAFGANIIFYE